MTAGYLSRFGDWPFLLVMGLLCIVWLFLRGHFEPSRLLLLVLMAGMLSGITATIIRNTVGRARPNSQLPQKFYGPRHDSHWTVGKYKFGSFPSGHAATVVGLAAAVWLFHRRLGLLAAIFAAAVAWSRVALGCHYFSDVVAAAVLGIFVGPSMARVLDPWLKFQWAILQTRWLERGGRIPPDQKALPESKTFFVTKG